MLFNHIRCHKDGAIHMYIKFHLYTCFLFIGLKKENSLGLFFCSQTCNNKHVITLGVIRTMLNVPTKFLSPYVLPLASWRNKEVILVSYLLLFTNM